MTRLIRSVEACRGWRALGLAFLLGALASLAMPPVHAVPVLLLALPGLVLLIGQAGNWRRAAVIGWFFGWGHHVVGLYWITHSILTEVERLWWLVPIAVPALALFMGLYSALPAVIAWMARPGWPRVAALAGSWVVAEFLRGWVFTGFPWNLLGTVWSFAALPIQGAAYAGVHGLSLLTVLLACTPLLGRRAMAGGLATVALLAGLGWARLRPEEPAALPVTLVLVQGNVAQQTKWRPEMRVPIFRRYVELSAQGIAEAARVAPGTRPVVVWPETASPFLLEDDADARRFVAGVLPENGLLLAGSVRGRFGPDGRPTQLFNSLLAIRPDASIVGTYDKAYLVPFGEYMPASGLLPVRVIRGGVDFSAGPGPVAMPLPGLPAAGPLICYEVIFTGAVVGAERPGWLLNVTNDAWFGISAGPHQHLATARLRAVEEGLPMVRAAQTGISAAFDSRGRELTRLPLGETGYVLAPLPVAGAPTLFAQWGLALPGLLAAMSLLAAAIGTRKGLAARP